MHIGALYQFNGSNGAGNTAAQFQLGGELAGASVDAYYAKKKGAIATSSLSATQVNQLSGVPQTDPVTGDPIPVCTATPAAGSKAPPCVSVDNALAATISDNTTYSIMGLYNFGALKIYAGYENIKFENPDTPIEPGFITIGGYQLAFTSNTAYTSNKTLEVVWTGVKWALTPEFELTGCLLRLPPEGVCHRRQCRLRHLKERGVQGAAECLLVTRRLQVQQAL